MWASAVRGTSFVSLDHDALVDFLSEQAERLLDALSAEPFDRSAAVAVGKALVAAHFTEVGSLEATMATLGMQLAGCCDETRLTAMHAALAAGYAQALQERTRAEQEEISAAAFAARAAAEKARWASEARFAAVFAEAAIGISVADLDGVILEANRALLDMFGYRADEFLGRVIWDFVHPQDQPGVWESVQDMVAGKVDHLRMEKAYFRKDGSEIWTELTLSLVRDPDGQPRYVVAMVENITERRRLEEKLRYQAQHDPLTGLPNRALFYERLQHALDAGHGVGVCYLDLDGFKAVNDTLGHDVGDRLLQIVARRLDETLRSDGQFVARMGGDEFVVLVEHCRGVDQLREVAQSALDTVRQPVRVDGHHLTVSASIGVVERTPDMGGTELMKAADTTLYWAKNHGRDRYALFDPDRHRTDVNRFALSARMPEALNRREFTVEYQPLVRLSDGRTIGLEALVRWRRPGGTTVDPSVFIPLAEETGLILPLGRWVLAEACRQARQWCDQHPDLELVMSVNVAARQIREPSIVDDVAEVLAETGWPPCSLQLELTESDVIGSTSVALDSLNALAEMGIRIAIDDFGTGYSNFAYLRTLPVHAVKLAGPFVSGRGGGADEVDWSILATLVHLAHTLGLTVTAENVETAEQRDRLLRLGCDSGQGWFFAPSLPPSAVPPLLRRPCR